MSRLRRKVSFLQRWNSLALNEDIWILGNNYLLIYSDGVKRPRTWRSWEALKGVEPAWRTHRKDRTIWILVKTSERKAINSLTSVRVFRTRPEATGHAKGPPERAPNGSIFSGSHRASEETKVERSRKITSLIFRDSASLHRAPVTHRKCQLFPFCLFRSFYSLTTVIIVSLIGL